MKIFYLLFCIMLSIQTHAQNFRTILPQLSASFISKSGNDSIYNYYQPQQFYSQPGGVIYTNFRSADDDIVNFSYSVLPWGVSDTSWIGGSMIILSNGDELYRNESGDSILFRYAPQLYDRWVMYHFVNGDYIQARYDSIYYGDVYGNMDSIRIISLQVYDSLNVPVSLPINNVQFRITQHYGFYELIGMRHFPSSVKLYRMAGLENPSIGAYKMELLDLYNYDIGDVFQYRISFCTLNTTQDVYEQYRILNKQVFNGGDSVVYSVEDSSVDYVQDFISYPFADTIANVQVWTWSFQRNNYFYDRGFDLSARAYQTGYYYSSSDITLLRKSTSLNNRRFLEVHNLCPDGNSHLDDCHPYPIHCQFQGASFLEGVGFFSYLDNESACYQCFEYLSYYRKGTEVMGSPFNLTLLLSAKQESFQNKFVIAPLPFDDVLTISSSLGLPYDLTLTDLFGKTIRQFNGIQEKEFRLALPELSPGIYLIQFKTATGIMVKKVLRN